MRKAAALLTFLLTAAYVACAAPPSWEVARARTAPVIDGALDDACWQELTKLDNFRNPRTGEAAQTQTHFRVLFDDDALYFAVVCPEPDMEQLRADLKTHDDTLWTDDCVEFFIDPSNRRQSYAHIIVNPNGAVYDAWRTNAGASTDMDYESGAEAETHKNADSWQVEVRIPFAGLRLPRDVGREWGFNLCREKKTKPVELSCWSPPLADGFHKPETFGTLTGLSANFKPHLISIGAPQFRDPCFEDGRLVGKLLIPYTNWTGRDRSVRVRAVMVDLDHDKTQTDANAVMRQGQGKMLVPVTAPQAGFADLRLEIRRKAPEKLLHRSRHAMDLDYQPIQITFIEPSYRDTIYAGLPSSEIICRLKVNLPRRGYAGSGLRVSFNSGAAELAVRRVRRVSRSGEAQVAFSSEIVPAGEYTIKAQAIKQGKVIAEGQKAIRKVKPQAHAVVIDREGSLLVDGQRFFPCGFMGAGPDERLAKAGFNTIHTYVAWYIHRDEDLNDWLDRAQRLGLKVIMEPYPGAVGFHGFRGRPGVTEQDLEDIREFVGEYRSHPALLAWYMCDEPRGAVWRASLQRVYQVVADADPYHPCVALDNSASTLLGLQKAADILWIDPYPGFAREGGPKEPLSMVARALTDLRAGLPDNRPIWIAPQAFSYGEWDKAREATERAPTLSEIRFMHYLALFNGANGIIPFAWKYTQRHPSTLHTYCEVIGPEMAILMPAILNGEAVEHCRVIPLEPEADIRMGVWRYEGSLYIIVINLKPEETRVRLFIPGLGNRWLKVLAENRRTQAFASTIEESLPPHGVRIYSDRKKLRSVMPLYQVERRIKYDEEAKNATW